MTDNKLNDLAMQMVNSMKTMDDFKQIQQIMLQQFINNSLEAEMQEHLGYAKHEKSEQPNKRNGKMRKTVGTELGDIQIDTPRDRDSSFEPKLVKKNQTRTTGIDEQGEEWQTELPAAVGPALAAEEFRDRRGAHHWRTEERDES